MKTLILHELDGNYWIASINNGEFFDLGYWDVEDYMTEKNITNIENKTGE